MVLRLRLRPLCVFLLTVELQLKAVPKGATRQLTRITNSERSVAFETLSRVRSNTGQIVVQVEDSSGSRLRVFVPVFTRRLGASPVGGQKYALIIGISRYKNNLKGIRNLQYADADANRFMSFTVAGRGRFYSREHAPLIE